MDAEVGVRRQKIAPGTWICVRWRDIHGTNEVMDANEFDAWSKTEAVWETLGVFQKSHGKCLIMASTVGHGGNRTDTNSIPWSVID